MARRNDHSKQELKIMAIEAGRKIINESGFSALSTRAIAKEIDYTVGTLYNIFADYDDIVLNINATILDDLKNYLSKKNPLSTKQLAHLYIKFAQKYHNDWSALFEYNFPDDAALPSWYQEKIEQLFLIVEDSLKEISSKSDISKHAKVIWSGIHGICMLKLRNKLNITTGIDSAEVLCDMLIENYLRGIK